MTHSQENGSPAKASYKIKDGRMYITLNKNIDEKKLNKFVQKYDLSDLGLPKILFTRHFDSLLKMGWRIDINNRQKLVFSKKIGGIDQLGDPEKIMALTEDHPNSRDLFPSQNDNLVYGFNHFEGKYPFAVKDSLVTFFLKDRPHASEVLLAGSFTDWQHTALKMTRTDSGWIAIVKLKPGKYWYKFIVDGGWMTDPDNRLHENDPSGNTNSVYYKSNTLFSLPGHTDGKEAYLTGSFNGWNPRELPMKKGPFGWSIHLYLAEGTYTYKFEVDGKLYQDPANPRQLPDGHKGFNSVFQLGKPHLFTLKGYPSATSVALAGSFNGWQTYDLLMHKTAQGWELPYTLGPGNYEYRFLVDGKWIDDPANPLFVYNRPHHVANAFLIIQPNYTFRLEGYPDARSVYLAGDFNEWTPNSLRMRREGNAWIFNVHLSVGKHLYKFIVDNKWIKDPGNPLWEENEVGTDNSVIWMEEK
jgi:1,4-alpha-glucan branching enzyme